MEHVHLWNFVNFFISGVMSQIYVTVNLQFNTLQPTELLLFVIGLEAQ
jgi:hypothetical protein